MTQIFESLWSWSTLADLVDILVVWYAVYRLIMLVRGTKAVQLFRGILVIAVIRILAWYLGLKTVGWIVDQVIGWAVIAIVIIFQPEIRRGLEHLVEVACSTAHPATRGSSNCAWWTRLTRPCST